jgi:hypothetical protein
MERPATIELQNMIDNSPAITASSIIDSDRITDYKKNKEGSNPRIERSELGIKYDGYVDVYKQAINDLIEASKYLF